MSRVTAVIKVYNDYSVMLVEALLDQSDSKKARPMSDLIAGM